MWLLCLSILLFTSIVSSFPQGAPPEACESLSPQRGHGVPSQPVEQSPILVIQHGKSFQPGDRIAVEIVQRQQGVNFRGFLVQALDAQTHEMIGDFLAGQGMQIMRECSAVTHGDHRPKRGANLVWLAPQDRSGEVLFRASIVVRKEEYYANMLAMEASELQLQ